MKKCLSLPLMALAILTMFLFLGCGAKETPPITTSTAETPPVQESQETLETRESAEEGKHHESPKTEAEHESAEKHDTHAAEEETHHETEAEAEETIPTVEIPSDSVLHLIPEQTLGIIYCPSLAELDDRINMLATDLMPMAEPPEVLASILADTFGAGFESLAELEEIGLDLNQDFAIFMTSLKPPDLSATVHLTEPEAMRQVIEAESEGSAPTQYNGVTYWSATGGDGNFAIIDNTLVFSQLAEVCESVIDTYNGTKKSVTANPGYGSFLADIAEGSSQLAVHFNLESVAPALSASLEGELESMRDNLESDPTAMAIAPLFEGMFKIGIDVLDQVKSLSATLEVEGTDVQLAPFLEFKSGGKIHNALKDMNPHQLVLLSELPSRAFMNGGLQGKPELLMEINMFWLKMLAKNAPEQSDLFKSLVEQAEDFFSTLGNEWAFTVNYGDSILPDYLVIYELKDEQRAKTYMDKTLLEQLRNSMQVMRGIVGDTPYLNIYDGAHAGTPIMHNGVEIKSYIFPNFGSMFGEILSPTADVMPKEWKWHYAFHGGRLLLAMGGAELVKTALDQQTEPGETLSENLSYQKLTEMLGTDNNVLLAVSPMTAAKSIFPIIARMDPDDAAAMQMLSGMFMNMPETYSIGFSAKVEESGIGTKLLLTLGDFKQIIQMLAMMQGMGQMQ